MASSDMSLALRISADPLTISDGVADPRSPNLGPSISKNGSLTTPNPPGRDQQDLQITHHQHFYLPRTISAPSSPILLSKTQEQLASTHISQPIQIPAVSLPRSDPNYVSTPVSARGERKGHFFPYPRTPSPQGTFIFRSSSWLSHSSSESNDIDSVRGSGRRWSSSSYRSLRIFSMHSEQYSGRYTPTSPLSPKLPSSSRPLSPQPVNMRPNHARQTSRNLHMTLPRYHPANFQHHNPVAGTTTQASNPTITLHRVNQVGQIESPRSMREKQRELLDSVRLSSIIAASPGGRKPDSPRLDPLGSPKGPVTPLALEETTDYFSVAGAGKPSPAASPGSKSVRSDTSIGKEEGKPNIKQQVEVYR